MRERWRQGFLHHQFGALSSWNTTATFSTAILSTIEDREWRLRSSEESSLNKWSVENKGVTWSEWLSLKIWWLLNRGGGGVEGWQTDPGENQSLNLLLIPGSVLICLSKSYAFLELPSACTSACWVVRNPRNTIIPVFWFLLSERATGAWTKVSSTPWCQEISWAIVNLFSVQASQLIIVSRPGPIQQS